MARQGLGGASESQPETSQGAWGPGTSQGGQGARGASFQIHLSDHSHPCSDHAQGFFSGLSGLGDAAAALQVRLIVRLYKRGLLRGF